ncbi:hypothetical protein BC834DRAFT_844607 [Gloeopeniophorella convolvens]|nr:hypothetical protein BC834DRAFT_844607 [Gloeopeniophorella convolvens]
MALPASGPARFEGKKLDSSKERSGRCTKQGALNRKTVRGTENFLATSGACITHEDPDRRICETAHKYDTQINKRTLSTKCESESAPNPAAPAHTNMHTAIHTIRSNANLSKKSRKSPQHDHRAAHTSTHSKRASVGTEHIELVSERADDMGGYIHEWHCGLGDGGLRTRVRLLQTGPSRAALRLPRAVAVAVARQVRKPGAAEDRKPPPGRPPRKQRKRGKRAGEMERWLLGRQRRWRRRKSGSGDSETQKKKARKGKGRKSNVEGIK